MNRASILSPKADVKSVVQVTLTSEQYKRLEDMFPARATDSATQTAIYLGQQMVLQAIRKGFVAE